MNNVLLLTPTADGGYIVAENYSIEAGGCVLEIPAGYRTNGADIPRLFWRFYPPFSPRYMRAVVAHDYLCDLAAAEPDKAARKEKYKFADSFFYEVLKNSAGVGKMQAIAFYQAVRIYHKFF